MSAKGLSLSKSSDHVIVTDNEIAEVATAWTRVPVTKMSVDESLVLARYRQEAHEVCDWTRHRSASDCAISSKSEMWISE